MKRNWVRRYIKQLLCEHVRKFFLHDNCLTMNLRRKCSLRKSTLLTQSSVFVLNVKGFDISTVNLRIATIQFIHKLAVQMIDVQRFPCNSTKSNIVTKGLFLIYWQIFWLWFWFWLSKV